MKANILIVEDEKDICRYIRNHLLMEGDLDLNIFFAYDRDSALEMMVTNEPDLIISDLWLPDRSGVLDKEGGLRLLEAAMEMGTPPEVIIITGHSSTQTTLQATHIGAYDYIVKPIDYANLVKLVKNALEKRELTASNIDVPRSKFRDYEIIGSTPEMIEIMKAIGRLSKSDDTILILGENGTGKELIARSVHAHSPRKSGPFVAVNVNAIVPELMEAELFGIGKRVATGVDARPGFFSRAEGGTLFLDEIGELSLDIQPKLLRAIDHKEIQRVGSPATKVDVRIIAATNRDLRKAAEEGTFRMDLYFRLSAATINVPPLRERRADVPLLADYFFRRYTQESGKTYIKGFGKDVHEMFDTYDFPGNIRELENAIKYAISVCRGGLITMADMPLEIQNTVQGGNIPDENLPGEIDRILEIEDLKEAQEEFERIFISKKLAENSWNVSLTAKKLGITRQQLHKKIRKMRLERQ